MSNGGLRFTKDEMNGLINALEEAVYLLAPTDEDIQKKSGVYRIVAALEKLKGKREWVGLVAQDTNRIFFKDEYKALLKTDAVALANFLIEVEDTLKEKNT
jgi:hypothetical protein